MLLYMYLQVYAAVQRPIRCCCFRRRPVRVRQHPRALPERTEEVEMVDLPTTQIVVRPPKRRAPSPPSRHQLSSTPILHRALPPIPEALDFSDEANTNTVPTGKHLILTPAFKRTMFEIAKGQTNKHLGNVKFCVTLKDCPIVLYENSMDDSFTDNDGPDFTPSIIERPPESATPKKFEFRRGDLKPQPSPYIRGIGEFFPKETETNNIMHADV
jgi:hypothetical protein